MEFEWPFVLPLLVLVPMLLVLYILVQRRRRKFTLRYADLSLVKEAMEHGPGLRRHIPPVMMLGALGLMLFATARPVALIAAPGQEGEVILAIDTSGSMQADDLKPTRVEAAKAAARSFVDRQPGGIEIGVVQFSDDAQLVQAPTTNRDDIISAIDRLEPQGGTAIGSAIRVSLNTLLGNKATADTTDSADPQPAVAPGSYSSGFIVLLTDGENTWGPPPVEVAQKAAAEGVRIYTVGIGSAAGSVLHINGQSMHAGLDELTLKEVANMTGARYYNALSETDLKTIYENISSRLVLKTERQEITAGFTAAAALLSFFAISLSMLWFNRIA